MSDKSETNVSLRRAEQNLDALRTKIRAGDRGGAPGERDALLEFSEQLLLLSSTYSAHRHLKLLRHGVRMAEEAPGDLAAAIDDRSEAEAIVRWINENYDNPETNRDYRVALRVFAKRVTGADEVPDAVAWVPANTPSSYNPMPDPAAMLDWSGDVKPMIDAAPNPRDAALIATAFDSGARSGELHSVRVGDITASDVGLRLRVDGKTGERSVTLLPAEPYLARWLGDHPAADDSRAPLWCQLGTPSQLSYHRFLDVFKACGKRANVSKPVTPTNFRKSNASWLARQGANAALIEDRQGRARNSEAVSRYVARFGADDESAQYAALHGIEMETGDPESLAPVECPRCEELTPRDEPLCVGCGRAMAPGAAETVEKTRSTLRTAMAESDDPATRAELLELLQELDDDASAASRLLEDAARLVDSVNQP